MRHRAAILVAFAAVGCSISAAAQSTYRDPPPAVARILDAPLTPLASVSPDRRWLLLLERPGLPSIDEVAAPDLKLAGVRINPVTNGSSRPLVGSGLMLRAVGSDAAVRVRVPAGARLGDLSWAPDGQRIAFTVTDRDRISLWVADAQTGQAAAVGSDRLNGTFGAPCDWLPSSSALVCLTVPPNRAEVPTTRSVPAGPVIQESEGRAAPNRTYQDLLQNSDDEARFEHYFTSQIVRIALDGSSRPLGKPALHSSVSVSPDGRFLLVQTLHRPFSYLVPYWRFPLRSEVWDQDGQPVASLVDVGLQEEVPPSFDAVPTGPRQMGWRGDAPATVVWVEALDGGNPATPAESRDRVMVIAAPFNGQRVVLADLGYRLQSIAWGRSDLAVVEEDWAKTRRSRTWIVNPSSPGSPRLLWDRSSEDSYGDPGSWLLARGSGRDRVLELSADGKRAYLAGTGASPEGDRPFLDELDLATGKTSRLWRSAAPYFEEVVSLVDPARGQVLTRREAADQPPNYFLRNLRARVAPLQLTQLPDPAPEFAGVTKQLLTYTRADGVQLSATMYLPPGYVSSQGRLPFFFWAYPREFKTAAAAAQVVGSPYRFTRPSGASHLFLVLQGYGVLDGPTMPIVGEGEKEPNDSYVEQLVSSAKAAVDKVVSMGVADPNRIGVGGHSYGAFMTANLLAHSDLFRAGVARSGAYNRTLTPFGFQAEERTYWEAPAVYARMSPFTYANQIKEPILLIHGIADDNSGTFPIQSERLYAAIKGNGGKARLVMLPAEAHGYRARQSIGHTLFEMIAWLDKYVKGGGKELTP